MGRVRWVRRQRAMSVGNAMPRRVKLAVALLWAGLAFAALSLLIDFGQAQAVPTPASSAGIVLVYLVWSALTVQVARGRNWARIVYLLLVLIGLPFNLHLAAADFGGGVLPGLVTAVSIAAPVVGLWLLFTSPGKAWFGRSPA